MRTDHMTPQQQQIHSKAQARAERAAAILCGFASNPASAWHGMEIKVIEFPKVKHHRPAPSRFDVVASSWCVKTEVFSFGAQ